MANFNDDTEPTAGAATFVVVMVLAIAGILIAFMLGLLR